MQFEIDGEEVEIADDPTRSLLDVLRSLGHTSVKDGCSPQGQCGCCTVLVDDAPRVACVTPARRVAGRSISTVDGLTDDERKRWVEAFLQTGASQCGFCTPGIVCRLVGAERKGGDLVDDEVIGKALAAHLCRCTGWQTIGEAAEVAVGLGPSTGTGVGRDLDAAARQASLEGGAAQTVGAEVVLGRSGFADDVAPADALVAVSNPAGEWFVAETLAEARAAAGKVQGRRTTLDAAPPIPVPAGDWAVSLATSWVEPAYLEPDAVWATPDGALGNPLANGGAFGAKIGALDELGPIAKRLAAEHERPVRVLWSREDVARRGPKRPPLAAGLRADGTGRVVLARTAGVADAIAQVLPNVEIEEVDLAGPPTSAAIRGAGWAEATALATVLRGSNDWVAAPGGGRARADAQLDADGPGRLSVELDPGVVLDEVVLRSYAIGAAHMAFSWVASESLTVDPDGEVHDLTIRSFGVVRALDTPVIDVAITPSGGAAGATADAVFAAVAGAVWLARVQADDSLRHGSWPLG